MRNACVAEATGELDVIDMIASGVGKEDLHFRLIRELEIQDKSFEEDQEILNRSSITLREIRDNTQLSYNQIRQVIAVLINGYNTPCSSLG